MNVLVLAGGPDREREVSRRSGAAVAAALREVGHAVTEGDVGPNDWAALDAFAFKSNEGVVFPALHGKWGEGGPLQRTLDERGLRYVGAGPAAARLAMDKQRTKRALAEAGVPSPACEVLSAGERPRLDPPAVVKPVAEGSSIALTICRDERELNDAVEQVRGQYEAAMVERYVPGRELTVGVLDRTDEAGPADGRPRALEREGSDVLYQALPVLEIIPAGEHYDYHAKYDRDDTRYSFQIDLPQAILDRACRLALASHAAVGARHLSRVDFMVDQAGEPWVLEINTMPGFTDHSLLPMAAARRGLPMPALTDRLVRLAAHE